MGVHIVNPLLDPRWDEFVDRHPLACAFHSRGWLQALAYTYGYRPLVLTRAAENNSLNDGIALCSVSSSLTGSRLVSLPFTDHCEPLVDHVDETQNLLAQMRSEPRKRWRYIELRPLSSMPIEALSLKPVRSYWFHEVDLRPSLLEVFSRLHKDSIQRRIRRAEREGIAVQTGTSADFVKEFYRLLLKTRRRHHLLPQPYSWFCNLIECMGDKAEISLARKNDISIAALFALRHRTSVVYKYGCSDESHHHLGAMPLLFWRLIEESKARGAETLDLGRSDLKDSGLIVFKDKLGAQKRLITYYRQAIGNYGKSARDWDSRGVRKFFSVLPDSVFSAAGRLLYRHMG